jgi:hypothetical protein
MKSMMPHGITGLERVNLMNEIPDALNGKKQLAVYIVTSKKHLTVQTMIFYSQN